MNTVTRGQASLRVVTTIGQYFPFLGGAENVARYLVEHTNDEGFENNVLTIASERMRSLIDNQDDVCKQELENGGNPYLIYRFNLCNIFGKERNGQVFRYYTLLQYIFHLWKLRKKFDVIHAHTYYWSATGAIVAGKILRKPVIVTGHNRISRLRDEVVSGEYPKFMIRLLRKATRYVAISEEIESEACSICNLPEERVVRIYNGIDVTKYRAEPDIREKDKLRVELNIPVGKRLIVYHGRLDEHKNIQGLLRVLAKIGVARDQWMLLVLGEGVRKSVLESIADELGLQEQVEFLGFRRNAEDYLRASDVYCLPSYLEGFSLALLEAMASGLVCLASDIEGNRDAICHQENGFLFDPDDEARWIELFNLVLGDMSQDECVQLGTAARQRVVDEFSLLAMVNKYKALYVNVLNQAH